MKYVLLLIFEVLVFTAFSQQTRTQYIEKYQMLAIEEMQRTGIPASIKMAQACLESANGNSNLSKLSNNHFGIKCKSNWTGPSVKWDDDERNECFRKYNTVEESFIDHSNFLVNSPRYASLFQLAPNDYVGWAHGLKAAGYATAPDYAQRVIKIIEDNKLYLLDSGVNIDDLAIAQRAKLSGENVSDRLKIDLVAHKVINVNHLKAVVAREGDTYEIIAQGFRKKAWEIYHFNDQPEGYRPQKNEVVYIQKKHKKAQKGKDFHRVEAGETMHFISQVYGVRLNMLYKRNKMKPGEEPKTEEVIYLRKKRR
ncbi:MAG: glycoside hydrolase family 73 protein [Draconibacterium sp.]